MSIELSNLTFTDEDDIVPASGVEEIFNTGIANTLAGNDRLTGVGAAGGRYGLSNSGTLNTAEGNDIITGTYNQTQDSLFGGIGIWNGGSIDTGDGNDIINGNTTTGIGNGIANGGSINTGNGNDIITGSAYNSTDEYYAGFNTSGDFNTGDGNDIITGVGQIGISHYGNYYQGYFNDFTTGEGNDIIMGIGMNVGFVNYSGSISTGGGNDIIIGIGGSVGLDNSHNGNAGGYISTDEGDDIIIGSGNIGIRISAGGYIDTGSGNDSIIANGGLEGGRVVLGTGNDYLKGFGSGSYEGTGNYYQPPADEDTLELTSGSYTLSYTVEQSRTAVNFTKNGIIMKTFQFEKLIAGSTTYDFSSLTEGQIITVA